MAKKWYVIHTYSGYEAKVRDALQQRAKQHGQEDKFGEILIPSETVTENRPGGKTRVRQKLSLPGYIFVEMEMSELVWHLVKDTPKVTWPTRTEVTNGTFVVIVTTIISTVFFALMDRFWGFVTNLVYGGT